MERRRWYQLGLGVVATSVVVLVALNWGEGNEPPGERPGPPVSEKRNVVAASDRPFIEVTDGNNVLLYSLQASSNVRLRDGRQEYEGDVELRLYGRPKGEEGEQELTTIRGDLLTFREIAGSLRDLRVTGSVRIEISDGSLLTTERVRYVNEDDVVETDAGVELLVAGLLVRARSLRYARESRLVEIWGGPPGTGESRVLIEPAQTDGPGIAGSAGLFRYDPDGGGLVLTESADLDLTDAAVAGGSIRLDLDAGRSSVERLVVENEALLFWQAGGEAGRSLEGDRLIVDLAGDGTAGEVRAEGTARGRPRMDLGEGAFVDADSIVLRIGDAGGGSMSATGSAVLDPGVTEGIDELRASALEVVVTTEGLERVDARAGVEAILAGVEGTVRGGSAVFTWAADRLRTAAWPDGFEYESSGARLEAAGAHYDDGAEEAAWVADGLPRPTVEVGEARLRADTVTVVSGGSLQLDGDVTGAIDSDLSGAAVAVFGEGREIQTASGRVVVRGDDEPLLFEENVRFWSEGELLQAATVTFGGAEGTLRAGGGIFLVLEREDGELELSGGSMLVEGDPAELRVAGQARLEESERAITGSWLLVRLEQGGGWGEIEASGGAASEVVLEDPQGRATGAHLAYATREDRITVDGDASRPAVFRNDSGVEVRDPKGLEIRWTEDGLVIRTLEQGTVQTVRGGTGQR